MKEWIISQKLLWIRRDKYCVQVIYAEMFHIWKDFLALTRNPQVAASYFTKSLTVMLAPFPLFKIAAFLKSLNLICWKLQHFSPNARIASWHHLWSIFRKKWVMKFIFGARRILWNRSLRPSIHPPVFLSVRTFSWDWLIRFFWNLA